jgi:hypothetical protein
LAIRPSEDLQVVADGDPARPKTANCNEKKTGAKAGFLVLGAREGRPVAIGELADPLDVASRFRVRRHAAVAVDAVLGGTKVEGLRLRDTVNDAVRDVPMEGLFIAIGYRPNTEVFKEQLEVDDKGYLVVHDETGSKIQGVFIAGDVHDHHYRQAVTAAGDGCKAAIDAERWLASVGEIETSTATNW